MRTYDNARLANLTTECIATGFEIFRHKLALRNAVRWLLEKLTEGMQLNAISKTSFVGDGKRIEKMELRLRLMEGA